MALHHLELHQLAEPGLSVLAGFSVWRFLKDRRPSDVAHDEQASPTTTRPPACSLEGTIRLMKASALERPVKVAAVLPLAATDPPREGTKASHRPRYRKNCGRFTNERRKN